MVTKFNGRFKLWFFPFILLIFIQKLVLCSEIEELSDASSSESNPVNGAISIRPEGAVSMKFNKSVFDAFKKEVVVDKYITKEGRKVKVILRRKRRPIFNRFYKWRKKKRAKKEAKKKYKARKGIKKSKRTKLFNIFSRGHKPKESGSLETEIETEKPKVEVVDEGSSMNSDIFEEDAEVGTSDNEDQSNRKESSGSYTNNSDLDSNSSNGNSESSLSGNAVTSYSTAF
ncbi:hypothetical protein HWI79_1111 [Cryptosporidium felis]|nr:hypothetical protein HWI79_1111 [Cryptosporidium felis]